MAANSTDPDLDPIVQNTVAMLALNDLEQGAVSSHQQLLERISEVIGSPLFIDITIFLVGLWIAANLLATRFHYTAIDNPPFFILQGVLGFAALLTTMVILTKQNRLEKMDRRRAHLELQVNLLAEQKVTKLIDLVEELRRDLPMIKDRHDAKAAAFQVPIDPETVLKALDDRQDM